MNAKKGTLIIAILLLFSLLVNNLRNSAILAQAVKTPTDPNLKVAFIGDTGYGDNARAVLNLIKNEGADMVLHQGDMSYGSENIEDAINWHSLMVGILGSDYPYFGSMGNHDDEAWIALGGYQDLLEVQATKAGAKCSGNYGINSICTYRGLEFILSEGGNSGFTSDDENEQYIRDQFDDSSHLWKICAWHHNQSEMQVGGKESSTGWGVYEACRETGAIIATAHEHSYSRTKTLTNMTNQTVDTAHHPVDSVGVPQNPDNLIVSTGRTFAFVSGIGGKNIRDQERCWPYDYPYGCSFEWARIVTTNQEGTDYGALFITFNVDGMPNTASGEFKTIKGDVLDSFTITTGTSEPISKEFELYIPVVGSFQGHDLGPFEPVEVLTGGYEARCRRCNQSAWVGDSRLMYSLLGEKCRKARHR